MVSNGARGRRMCGDSSRRKLQPAVRLHSMIRRHMLSHRCVCCDRRLLGCRSLAASPRSPQSALCVMWWFEGGGISGYCACGCGAAKVPLRVLCAPPPNPSKKRRVSGASFWRSRSHRPLGSRSRSIDDRSSEGTPQRLIGGGCIACVAVHGCGGRGRRPLHPPQSQVKATRGEKQRPPLRRPSPPMRERRGVPRGRTRPWWLIDNFF